MKQLKKLCIITLLIISFLLPSNVVQAAKKEPKADDAKNGVVQVNTVFTDDEGIKHVVSGGTGFIVGDSENTEYVITCNHLVNPTDEYKYAAYEFYGIPNTDDKWSKISLTTEVVVEGDVVITASLMNASTDLHLAILQLSQPIYTRSPLTILTEKNYDVNKLPYGTTEAAYALGYPDAISYASAVQYYSVNQVGITAGHIVNLTSLNGVQVIESDAAVGENNCGGPLVDDYGYVIGMNLSLKDGMYSCALDSTKLAIVLDGLGVNYAKVTERPSDQDKEGDGTNTGTAKTKEPEPKNVIPKYFWIIIGVAIVLVVTLFIVVIVLLVNRKKPEEDKAEKKAKKKEKKKNKKDKGPSVLDRYFEQAEGGSEDEEQTIKYTSVSDDATTILSSDIDEDQTTILSGDLRNTNTINAYLIRKGSGEQINISKPVYSIGKDSTQADYIISGNKEISRKHVIIKVQSAAATIEDCGSTNGSWLNGAKLAKGNPVRLNNGDIIRLANEEFEFRYR